MTLTQALTGIVTAASIGAGAIVYEGEPEKPQAAPPAEASPPAERDAPEEVKPKPLPGCAWAWPPDAEGWGE